MRDVGSTGKAEWIARAWLTLGTLLPYWQLLTFRALYVTDDGFMSDIWNGELPGRVLLGQLLREHGRLPAWTSQGCSGFPLLTSEPLSLAWFTLLPAAAALDALLITLLLVAAHGTYSLARRIGCSRPGAWLAGFSFALSGYIVTQLKHVSIVSTVVWFPLGLLCLDHALSRVSWSRRACWLALFGLLFGEQALSGFPQSLYICGLCYGAFALYRVLSNERTPGESFVLPIIMPLAAALTAVIVGAFAGAALLLPLQELGSVSDRAGGNSFEWATQINYWPRDALMFLFPYANGDVANGTYVGDGLFWEDYGYIGAFAFLLALFAVVRGLREGRVRFWLGAVSVAFAFVLGPATPVFRLAFDHLPGFNLFRFPTRFLIVVELGLCLLAGLGLSRLELALAPRLERANAARLLPLIVIALCVAAELDLIANQTGQNPIVDAAAWLEPPAMAKALHAEPGRPRVFTPFHMEMHRAAYLTARGWADVGPYHALRDLLQPNSNLYWNLSTVDCYAGIGARWYRDAWGDHTRGSLLVYPQLRPVARERRIDSSPVFPRLLATYGVTHVISPFDMPGLGPAFRSGAELGANLYRIPNAARVRVVEQAVIENDTDAVIARLIRADFDPNALVVLSEAPANAARAAADGGASSSRPAATLERDDGDRVLVHAHSPRGGYLVLADTWYPGWQARVDGKPAPIYRANLYVRAVPLAPGEHRVELAYRSQAQQRGNLLTLAACALLVLVLLGATLQLRRTART